MYLCALSIAALCSKVAAHSWTEQLAVVGLDGTFKGQNGYPRGFVARSDPSFNDYRMTYLLPPPDSGRSRVDEMDLLCAPTQRSVDGPTENEYPRLIAAPGSYVALKYLENGHVTMPTADKLPGSGVVYVFGTNQPRDDERFVKVGEWTGDGAGGDGRGRLLTSQAFDDGRCYQINNSTISTDRQEDFPNLVAGQPSPIHEQWCETDVMVPGDIAVNSTYTLYWVWQWETIASPSGEGKDEFYTTCSDLDIVESLQGSLPNPLPYQDPQVSAVPGYKSRAGLATVRMG